MNANRPMQRCILRKFNDPSLCSPLHPLYIGIHGHNGKGGRIANANIPTEYQGVLLADSPAREAQPSIYEKLDAYVKSFDKMFEDVRQQEYGEGKSENQVRIKSLYLWSESPGTGKTTTASALLNEYLLKYYIGTLKRKQTPSQRPAYLLDANQLQTWYNEFNRPRVPEDIAAVASRRYYKALEHGKHTDFVVIDDLATRSATEGFVSDLHSVINHRVTNKMPTIFTSNIPIEELPSVFGEKRLADRISDMCLPLHFKGSSHRGMRR